MPNPLFVKPRERTVVLLPGDYQTRWEALTREIDQLELEGESDKRKRTAALAKARELEALQDPANVDGAVVVTMREVPNSRWRQMQDDAPPRKGNQRDEVYGFDEDAFTRSAIRASIISPEITDDQFAEFAAQVSPANWRKLRDAAWDLSEREVDIPKSSPVSVLLQGRADASRRQRDTE